MVILPGAKHIKNEKDKDNTFVFQKHILSPIICYRTSPINYFIISRMLKIDDVGLPNLLLGSRKFPELIQKECTPKQILKAVESIDYNYLNSLSEDLRTLLIGSEETEYTNAILKL